MVSQMEPRYTELGDLDPRWDRFWDSGTVTQKAGCVDLFARVCQRDS